jgi:hypothetical protein
LSELLSALNAIASRKEADEHERTSGWQLFGNHLNPDGCLMILGDRLDGPALWLTPREIGGVDSTGAEFQCIFLTWEKDDATGLMALASQASESMKQCSCYVLPHPPRE